MERSASPTQTRGKLFGFRHRGVWLTIHCFINLSFTIHLKPISTCITLCDVTNSSAAWVLDKSKLTCFPVVLYPFKVSLFEKKKSFLIQMNKKENRRL